MNEKLVKLLLKKGYKISAAESCTGGMFASSIVDVADASKVLDMSFVTYASKAKIELINVSEKTINTYGVVSEEVAKEMALGVKQKSVSNIGVGITGLAGPSGGSLDKPVGMVCFGIAINDNVYTYTKQFGNIGRTNVRKEATSFITQKLIEHLS